MTQSSLVKASLFEIIRNSGKRSSKDPVLGYIETDGNSELLEGMCNKEAITKITVNYNGYSFSLLDVSFTKGHQKVDQRHILSGDDTYLFNAKDVVLERELAES